MDINEILLLDDFKKIKDELTVNKPVLEISDLIDQYDGEHAILKRVDKIVKGETVETAKIVVKYQKKIAETAVAFCLGKSGIKINGERKEDQEGVDILRDLWKTMKLDRHTEELVRRLFVETRVAEVFYVQKDKAGNGLKIRSRLLCQENGDEVFPYFDDYGDMVALTRVYKVKDEQNREIEAVDIFTADKIIKAKKTSSGWQWADEVNPVGKIPAVYYEQKAPEWDDGENLINRIEKLMSNHADTNDYIGNPAVKLKGKVKNMPKKDENVKIFEFLPETIDGKTTYGDAEYMVYTGMPESLKLEYDNLKDIMFSVTNTPDLSFNNVKGISNLSAEAFEFMFLDAMLKAYRKRRMITEGLERRVNVLREMVSKLTNISNKGKLEDLKFNFTFEDIMPKNLASMIDVLNKATGGQATMSRKTAVGQNPLVPDPKEEIKLLEEEDEANRATQESFTMTADESGATV